MNRLAAVMMFAAWLLYAAIPAMAMPGMGGMPSASRTTAEAAVHDHEPDHHVKGGTGHERANQLPAEPASHGANDDMQKPCPHGGSKACMAPFCAACLVLLPDIAFADNGRFIHPAPEPEDAASLVRADIRPPVPPPRA